MEHPDRLALRCQIWTYDSFDTNRWNPPCGVDCEQWSARLFMCDTRQPAIPELVIATANAFHFLHPFEALAMGDADVEGVFNTAVVAIGQTHEFVYPSGTAMPVDSIVYLDHVEVREDLRRLGLGGTVAGSLLRTLTTAARERLVVVRPKSLDLSPNEAMPLAVHRTVKSLGFHASGLPGDLLRYAHSADAQFEDNIFDLSLPSEAAMDACKDAFLQHASEL